MMARAFTIVAALAVVVGGCSQPADNSPLARGKRSFSEGKWDAAIDSLSEAIAKNPLDSDAYLYRGRAYHCRGSEHLRQAIADFNEAIRLSPNNYEAYYSRAYAFKERGEREKALADELKARRLDPNATWSNDMYSATSTDQYRLAIERSAEPEKPSNVADDVRENLPLSGSTRIKLPDASNSRTTGLTSPRDRGSHDIELRDTHGQQIVPPRNGSLTEELFGIGDLKRSNAEGRAGSNRSSPLGLTQGRTPLPDWQANALQPLDEPSPKTTKAASKPLPPVGWNPFQSGNSPYSPVGPRSTGLRGDPTLRDYPQAPFYDRRSVPKSVPEPPGLQAPLVPPP